MTSADHQQQDKIRLAVCGTSNAVFADGYVRALREHPAIGELVNLTLGGSSSNAFSYWRSRTAFAEFDYCLLDYCVNDATLVNSRFQNADNIRACLIEAILALRASGCEPLLLILPLRQPGEGRIPALYREVAIEFGVHFLDVGARVRDIAATAEISYESLFDDAFHLRRDLVSKLAVELLDAALSGGSRARGEDRVAISCRSHKFVGARQAFGAAFPLIERGTSLVAAQLVDLQAGAAADLIVDPTHELVGILVDLANSKSVLDISGRACLRLSLTSFNFVGGRTGLILTAWPLTFAIRPLHGRIRLHVLPDAPCDLSLHHELSPERREMPTMASIAGFILRIPEETFIVPA